MFWATTGAPQVATAGARQHPSSLAPLPRPFPPPWAAQPGFQAARQPASAQCFGLAARCSPHHPFTVGAGASPSGCVGWLEHTHSSFNCHLQPPPSDIFDAFHPTATRCPHVAAPIRIETRRQQLQLPAPTPSTGTICPVGLDTPDLGRGIGSSIWQSGGPERAQPQLACVAALEPYQIVIVSNLAPVHPAILAWLLLFQQVDS